MAIATGTAIVSTSFDVPAGIEGGTSSIEVVANGIPSMRTDITISPGAFGKSSPSNGATGQALNPTLSWAASSGATSYEYCVDTTNDNSCDTTWTSTASTSAALSGLSATTTYWWEVRARNATGTTDADSGTWWAFTTGTSSIRVNVAAAAQGGTATASSFVSAGYAPGGANNGDRKGVGWGSGGGWNDQTPNAFPDWLQVDFAGAQTIDEIDVFTLQDAYTNPAAPTLSMTFSRYGVTDFQVQYWDGAQWVGVPGGSVAGNNHVWRQFSFSAVTTSRIRVLVTKALASYSRLTEVEAYTASGGRHGDSYGGSASNQLTPSLGYWGSTPRAPPAPER